MSAPARHLPAPERRGGAARSTDPLRVTAPSPRRAATPAQGRAQQERPALKVVPRYPQTYFEGGVALAATEVARIEKQWQAEAMETVNAVKSSGQKREVKVKPMTAKGDLVAEAIIATAKRQKCDLIVMASHGRRGIKRLLLGSETQQVLTHSHIPVLVLR